jgi:hypothetical protein
MIHRPESQLEQMSPQDLLNHGLPKDDLTCYYINERKKNGTLKQDTTRVKSA